jgi:outer membrane immunogenic protein
MKKLLLATTAFVVLAAASASAADNVRPAYLPPPAYAPPPAYSWNGWYIGANVGYGRGNARYDAALNASALGFFVPEIGAGQAIAGTAISESQKIDGVIGGVQTGYNYQFGAWVWGWETDFQGSGQKGGSTFARTFNTPVIGPIPVSVTTDHKLQSFGTTRSRLGFLWDPNVLVYGTAGVAYGQVKDSATLNGSALGGAVTAAANATFKDVKAGWTVGAGIESALWGGWSVKLEYLYIDLGKTEQTVTATTAANLAGVTVGIPGVGAVNLAGVGAVLSANANQTFRTTDNIVRVGLNYKWGSY